MSDKYKCKGCGNIQDVSLWKYICRMHIGDRVYLKCPKCNKGKWHIKEVNNGN